MPDLNSNTVSGVVEEVVFHNSVSGFTVLEINCAGELVSAVGVVSEIAAGEEVKLQGKWVSHEVFGRQFKFDACRRSLPDTAAKLFRYLASGAVKGVGPKLAAKIIERFGEESFDVLENDPERLAVINGISKDKARKISDEFRRLTSLRQVLLELENYGVTPTESTTIYKYFGVNAVNVIKENPYILFGTINGFTFERSELIAEAMGLPPDSAYRRRAGIIYVVTHNLSNGHTCIPRRKLVPP